MSERLLAFYLPQYHPTPENDEWWEPGFTEWTNVVRGRPLFEGHYQPHLPGELGFYDLRVPEVREHQAELADEHGISGFVYYHYWFGGRRLLQRPLDDMLASGRPGFPFALCWANENWTRIWDGGSDHVLIGQDPSQEDDAAHARFLSEVFADPRYIRVDGRPLYLVYRASQLADSRRFTDVVRAESSKAGVGEAFLVRVESFKEERGDPRLLGFDAAVDWTPNWGQFGPPLARDLRSRIGRKLGLSPRSLGAHAVHDYDSLVDFHLRNDRRVDYERYPCVTPGFDNSVRRRAGGVILRDSTPERFREWLDVALARAERDLPESRRLVFVDAWNEWAEGNHLEPDARWGRAYLHAVADALGRRHPS